MRYGERNGGFRRTDSYGDVARLSFLDKRLVCNMNKAPNIEAVRPELDRSIRGPKKPDVKLAPRAVRVVLRGLFPKQCRASRLHSTRITVPQQTCFNYTTQ